MAATYLKHAQFNYDLLLQYFSTVHRHADSDHGECKQHLNPS